MSVLAYNFAARADASKLQKGLPEYIEDIWNTPQLKLLGIPVVNENLAAREHSAISLYFTRPSLWMCIAPQY